VFAAQVRAGERTDGDHAGGSECELAGHANPERKKRTSWADDLHRTDWGCGVRLTRTRASVLCALRRHA
jgi:hypothetical protein